MKNLAQNLLYMQYSKKQTVPITLINLLFMKSVGDYIVELEQILLMLLNGTVHQPQQHRFTAVIHIQHHL